MSSDEIHYRVLFEAINKFSISVFNASDFGEVSQILKNKIKYLLNCSAFEFYYFTGNDTEVFTLSESGSSVLSSKKIATWVLDLYLTGLPYYQVEAGSGYKRETRGWSFQKNQKCGSVIIIQSDEMAPFTNRYIPIIKLVNEIFCAKISNYILMNELDEKNRRIEVLVQEQEMLIEARTKKLKESNQNLTQLIQFNTHQIREPITRAISLMNLKDDLGMDLWEEEFWPDMQQAVSDLDDAVKSIVTKVDRLEPNNI